MTDMEKYEAKRADLRKNFRKQYLRVWLLAAVYNVVADIVIYFIRDLITYPIAIVVLLISTGLSLYLAFRSTAELKRLKTRQENQLLQDMPMGRIRL